MAASYNITENNLQGHFQIKFISMTNIQSCQCNLIALNLQQYFTQNIRKNAPKYVLQEKQQRIIKW